MRFLKIFFKVLVVFLVITSISVVGYVEGKLVWASIHLRAKMVEVNQLAHSDEVGSVSKFCFEEYQKDLIKDKDVKKMIKGFQLRFLSPKDYVIEMRCATGDTKELSRGTLEFGVKKMAGSGVFIPYKPTDRDIIDSKVLLGYYFGFMELGFEDQHLTMKLVWGDAWDQMGTKVPPTSCEGWGYECCSEILAVGTGASETRTTDCEGNCYASCAQRPQIIFFNSDPVMEPETRLVEVQGPTAEVRFGYEAIDRDGDIKTVMIDYGDGQQETSVESPGLFSHRYSCDSGCTYLATLQVRDNQDLEVVDSRNLTITVRVNP